MALVLRYVNKNGELIESFLGIVHVGDTSAKSLQKVITLYFWITRYAYQDSVDKVMMELVICKEKKMA
ncbi:hypothetical protein H5410_020533 [Solanum commersonii]|uniref:DUF4371 domain-containing protein n=1 Tax=Solanum commersonii TaxID=4109 RepID=A0A9J5ZCN6_SOLCO|nr:hypothetical protein H5410_020533 [Solanum commersonii]